MQTSSARTLLATYMAIGAGGPALLIGTIIAPTQAMAHVKWFCSTADVTQTPEAFSRVLTPLFAAVAGAFILMVFTGYLLDGAVARRWPRLASSGQRHAEIEEKLLRLAVGGYFLLLWDKGAAVAWAPPDSDVILTPELLTVAAWVPAVHFIIAASVAWRSTCIVAALAIGTLYGFGIYEYGIFHMTDYVFFPGIAVYLALSWVGTARARRLRTVLLTAGLMFGLMWTAIEKFVYPQWTLAIVAQHTDLAFGFPPRFAVVVAGFVEFTLAFFVMTGRGLVRVGAAVYSMIFIAAIPEFGHLDSVGHMPIVGILWVVCLHGGSPLQRLLGILHRRPLRNALDVSALYVLSLTGLFTLYYGLHWAEYG